MFDETITFETAKLAYEKNFKALLTVKYNEDGFLVPYDVDILLSDIKLKGKYFAPTQSLLQRWLREKHNIILTIGYNETYPKMYNWDIFPQIFDNKYYSTYEEALEMGLQKALKMI